MFRCEGKLRANSIPADFQTLLECFLNESGSLPKWHHASFSLASESGDKIVVKSAFFASLCFFPEIVGITLDRRKSEILYSISFKRWALFRMILFFSLSMIAGFLLLSHLAGLYIFPDFEYPSTFETAVYIVPMVLFWGVIWPLILVHRHKREAEQYIIGLLMILTAENGDKFFRTGTEKRRKYPHLPVWRIRIGWALLFLSLLGIGYLLHRRWRLGAAHFGYSFTSAQPDWKLPRHQEYHKGADLSHSTIYDFPGFLGKERNCAVDNIRLNPDWKSHPPKLLWRHKIGAGWSAFSVVNGAAVTMEQRGPEEQVTCYDAETGKHYWTVSWNERFFLFGDGPRSTPAIANGNVFALGAWGHLTCIEGSTGRVIWERELLKDLGINWRDEHKEVLFGRSNSPLVTDGMVIVPGGGKDGKYVSLLAYDAETGELRWKGGHRQISYSSPVSALIDGIKQIVIVNEDSVSGHAVSDGRELWNYPWPGNSDVDANVSQAVPAGDDRILLSSGYRHGAALIKIVHRDGAFIPVKIWRNPNVLRTKFTNVVIWENHIYGLSDTKLECVELGTGKRCWKKGRYGHGQILRVHNLLLVQSENGRLSLIRLSPDVPDDLLGSIQPLSGRTWNNIALYGRLLLLRNSTEAVCYELTPADDAESGNNNLSSVQAGEEIVSIAGEWNLKLGGENPPEGDFDGALMLPGSLQAQGYGNDISENTKWVGKLKNTSWLKYSGKQPDGSFKVAGWLQPKKHYIGKAWYQREITIPEKWRGKRVQLFLERPHITTSLFLDNIKRGEENSLSAPHTYDLGKPDPGNHILTLCVDNNLPAPVGVNAHCVTDHTQTAWNGIVGRIELRTVPDKYIESVMTIPDLKNRSVAVEIFYKGKCRGSETVKITVTPPEESGDIKTVEITLPDSSKSHTVIKFAEIAVWDEFNPNIYKLTAEVTDSAGTEQVYKTQFGFFDKRIENQQFVINNRPTLMRGTLDCASFPLTGYPSMNINYWRNVFNVCKSMGLNHVRYHSWTPPEAAFQAADEIGIYLQCENAWANVTNKRFQDYLMEETARIIRRFGNHPSFMMVAYGNEPGGTKRGGKGGEWLAKWVDFVRDFDNNRRFYTSASGWGNTQNSDYYDIMRGMRVYPWGAGLRSTINAEEPEFVSDFTVTTEKEPSKPYIGHESGQWCVFPDFDEIKLYKGFLKPENFLIFKKNMQDNHLFGKWKDFFNSSGKLQTLCYKYEIEKLRRTEGCGGYQLLGINDFPGQGTALVGPVNVFWKVKSYTSPEEYRCFNGETAILAKFTKFIYKSGETANFAIDISHYGELPIKNTELKWELKTSDGRIIKSDTVRIASIPLGLSNIVKRCSILLDDLNVPAQYRINLQLAGTAVHNYYDIWVYPSEEKPVNYGGIVITQSLENALKNLHDGKKVLLVPKEEDIIQPAERKPILGFSTIFWNTVWANRQPPTVMGINPDPEQPLFKLFPTENYSNYQWWYIIKATKRPLWLKKLPADFKPLLYLIDDWFTNRRFALLVETKVNNGKLLVSAIPIANYAKDNIVLNSFRNAVIEYMKSSDFNPSQRLTEEELESVISGR